MTEQPFVKEALTLRQKLYRLQCESRVGKDQTAKISGRTGNREYKFTSLESAIDGSKLHELGLYIEYHTQTFPSNPQYYILEARVIDVDSGEYHRCAKPLILRESFQDEGAAFSYWSRVLALKAMGLIPPSEEDLTTEEYQPVKVVPIKPSQMSDLSF